MAIGGPYEDLNAPVDTGSIPADGGQAIAQGQQMTDPNAAPAQQTQAGPQRSGGQNLKAGYDLSVQAPDYGRPIYNSDIVPHPDPRTVQHAGMAFSMPAFQIGAAAIGSRLQEQRNQQQQLEQAAQKLMGGATDDRAKVPAPYVRSYNKFADNAQNEFIQSLTAKYGSEKKAMEKMVSDPAIRRQWEQLNRDLNGTGEALAHGFSKSELFLNDVKKGHLVADEASVQAAQEYQNGYMGRGGEGLADLRVLKDVSTNFEKQSEPVYYFKEMGLDAHLKDAFAKSYDNFRVERNGQMIFTKYDDIEQAGKQLDDIAERTHSQFENLYPTLEEWKEKVHNMYPMRVELELNVQEKNNPPAGGSTPAGKVWTSPVQVNMANTDTGGGLVETVNESGVKRRTPAVQSISVGNVVDGRQEQFSKPVQFKQGNTPVKMIWTGIDRGADGSIMLVGYDPASIDTDTNVDDLNMEIGDLSAKIREDEKYGTPAKGETEDQFKARLADQKKRRSDLLTKVRSTEKSVQKRMVPLKGNEGVADGLLGGRLQQELAKFGAPAAKPASKSTADPLGIL